MSPPCLLFSLRSKILASFIAASNLMCPTMDSHGQMCTCLLWHQDSWLLQDIYNMNLLPGMLSFALRMYKCRTSGCTPVLRLLSKHS